MEPEFDTIILGGGAAGLYTTRSMLETLILEVNYHRLRRRRLHPAPAALPVILLRQRTSRHGSTATTGVTVPLTAGSAVPRYP